MNALLGKRILLVEDDTHLAENMCRALQALGAQVDQAADLQEALDRSRESPPATLVASVKLVQGTNAYETLRALSVVAPDERPLPGIDCGDAGFAEGSTR